MPSELSEIHHETLSSNNRHMCHSKAAFTFDVIRATPLSELQAQVEAQKATQEFQRAVEILRAAKETIALAEERLLEEDSRQFDSAWQEMLNHATQRVRTAHDARQLKNPERFHPNKSFEAVE